MPTRPALLLIVSLSLSGCHNHPVPTGLQNHVSPNEVAVYQAYLQDSFTDSKYPHKMWYVETETWPYQTFCDEKLLKDGVQPAYLRALRDLGTASYLIPPFNMDFVRTFDAYRPTVNGRAPDGPFITQTFSRVAFSPDGRQAFFRVEWVKGPGLGPGYPCRSTRLNLALPCRRLPQHHRLTLFRYNRRSPLPGPGGMTGKPAGVPKCPRSRFAASSEASEDRSCR